MRMPFAWLLKAHPLDLPGFLRELCFGMRGVWPVVMPHINYWRANQMFLRKREHDRAIWRIAQFVAEQPAIKGVAYSSWLFGVETGGESPHLRWLREFFAAENAQIIDAGPALADAGFLVGNERRGSYTPMASSARAKRLCCGLVRTYWPGRIATLNSPTGSAFARLCPLKGAGGALRRRHPPLAKR